MTFAIATRNVVRVISLGAVSYLALSLDFASGQKAFAQSNLPPVTVDAPGAATRAARGTEIADLQPRACNGVLLRRRLVVSSRFRM